jgi:cytochrome c553
LVFSCSVAVAFAAVAAHAQTSDPGRNVAASCASCHGANGVSQPGMPALAGRSKDELVRKMQDFKSGRVASTIMGQIAKGYSDEQIDLAADFFARQKR